MPLQSPAAEANKPFTKGPYLQAPGQITMTILWESTVEGEGTVHYGLDGKMSQKAGPGTSKSSSKKGEEAKYKTAAGSLAWVRVQLKSERGRR